MQILWVNMTMESSNFWVIFIQNIQFPKVYPPEIQ
jgi:hypothetical protein